MDKDNTPFVPDSTLSEINFINKFQKPLTEQHGNEELVISYLKLRYAWIKNKASWQATCEAFIKMKGGKP